MNADTKTRQPSEPSDTVPEPLTGATVMRQGEFAPDALQSDKVRHVYDWWHSAGGGVPPYWSQFDITEHPMIVANAFLLRRNAADAWFFVVKGEAVHALFPSHQTPEPIANRRDSDRDAQWAADLARYYDQVAATGRCHMVRGTIVNDLGEVVEFESIDCPFREGALGQMAILGVIEQIRVRPRDAD